MIMYTSLVNLVLSSLLVFLVDQQYSWQYENGEKCVLLKITKHLVYIKYYTGQRHIIKEPNNALPNHIPWKTYHSVTKLIFEINYNVNYQLSNCYKVCFVLLLLYLFIGYRIDYLAYLC